MTQALTSTCTPHTRSARTPLGMLQQILATQAQRRALAKLDTDALNDLGISKSDAHREATRPFWDF